MTMPNTSDPLSKYEIMRDWYTSVWENGDLDVIEAFYTCDAGVAEKDLLPENVRSAHEVREWLTVLRSFVTEIKVDIVQYMEKDDWASAVIEIKCKRRDTSADVHAMQLIAVRFEAEKVAEIYRSFDWIRFFEQLGQLPENTHALLLGGTVLK